MKGVLILKILYLLLFVFALLISGCDDGDNKASAPANNKPADTAAAPVQQKSMSITENKTDNVRFGAVEGKEYQLVKLSNTNIFAAPISITTTKKLSTATTMGQFLLIDLYVLNDGKEPITYVKNDFSLVEVEKKGNQFEIVRTFALDSDVIVNTSSIRGNKQSPVYGKINPGLGTIFLIPFEIPSNFDYANNGRLVIKFNNQDKPAAISLKVRTKA